jgi:multimeric flavodoxin WrbA
MISTPHELKLLRLSDFRIEPCKGCYSCLFKKGECVIQDDLNGLLEAIKGADALMVAAPTYFLGPNASLKRFLDRGFTIFARIEEFWGKPALGIGIAGIYGKEGYTLLGIESFLKIMMADIKGCSMLYGALPGEIFLNTRNEPLLSALAGSLFGKSVDLTKPSCPVCSGRTFRFIDSKTIKCMLCSNSGTLQFEDGRPVFLINRSEHEMFTSRESALSHREWLMGMKEKFLKHKNTLKEITLSYLRDGTWITPDDSIK